MDMSDIIEGRRDYECARYGEQEERRAFHTKIRAARKRGATVPALSLASGYDWDEINEICGRSQ